MMTEQPTRTATLFAILVALCTCVPAWAAPAPATSVEVARVIEGVIQEDVALIGSVVARRSTRISAQVAGLVEALLVDEGSPVNAGDELFRLNDDLASIEVSRARALLAQSEAEASDAMRKLTEAERLHREGHVPMSLLESAQTVNAVAQALRDERKAEVARTRTLLAQHVVSTPFSGTVVAKEAEVGQWIRTDTPVLVLAEMDPIRIEVPVPQNEFDRISVGANARVEFESLPGATFEAAVTNRIPQSRDGARTFPIWLEMRNEDGRLAPGMSADVLLSVDQSTEPSLLVPNDALIRRADASTLVWVVRDSGEGSGVAEPEPVSVGRARGGLREVTGTRLQAGDLVVVRGNESLRPNQPVRVINTTAIGG